MNLRKVFSANLCIIYLSLIACEPTPMTSLDNVSQAETQSGNTLITDNNTMAEIASVTIETGDSEADASKSAPLKIDFGTGATLDVFWKFQSSAEAYISIDLITSGLQISEVYQQNGDYWSMVTMPICESNDACIDDFIECSQTLSDSLECEYHDTETNTAHGNAVNFGQLPNIGDENGFPQVYQVLFRVCSDSNFTICDSASAGYVEIYN